MHDSTLNLASASILDQTNVVCGHCDLVIVDIEADSIQCDGCDRWYHSWRQCSGLKKTVFKLLRKKDLWACHACMKCAKQLQRMIYLLN